MLGLAAATGRAILGTIVLKQLYATREPPDWTMVHIPWSEILVKAGTWLVVMIEFLLTSRRYRRTINVNQPLAVPPLELRWLPYGPLSRGAQRLVGANIILVVVIILLCFSQHGFSPLWAAYFSAEVVLLLGTIVFALRRETI